jgi:hypothetical protein
LPAAVSGRPKEKQARAKAVLPPDRKIYDVADYADVKLVVVRCDSRATLSSSYSWQSGKSMHYAASVVIDPS